MVLIKGIITTKRSGLWRQPNATNVQNVENIAVVAVENHTFYVAVVARVGAKTLTSPSNVVSVSNS